MYDPQRLHPITMILTFGKRMKDFLVPFAILLFSGIKENHLYFYILLAGVLLFLLASAFISWLRHTYQFDEKELRIEHGVFVRKKRYIPYERIQSIDVTEGVLQRMFGLAKVQIETAGGNPLEGAEAVLPAISKQKAQSIQAFFIAAKESVHPELKIEDEQSSETVYQINTVQLLLLALTSGGVGVVVSAAFAILTQLDNVIPYKKWFGEAEKIVENSILLASVMAFSGFFILWIIAFIGMMLKYANYKVVKTKQDLIITYGLLARRQLTIPLNRIQAVRISENVLRQMLGLATVYLVSAGGSFENKEGARVMLIPLMKREQVQNAVNPLLTDYHINSVFFPLPRRAAPRYIIRSWFVAVPIVTLSLIFLKLWGLFSLILLAAATIWSYLGYKDAGWNIEEMQLSLRYRTMTRNTVFMKKNRVQSMKVRETFFQRRKRLATIDTFIKSGMGIAGGKVTDISQDDVKKIYEWYMAKRQG